MHYPAFLGVSGLAAALFFAGCAPQPHQVPFSESAFAGYDRSGTGKITGSAYTVLRDHEHTRVPNRGNTIKLMPANAYTEEIVTRRYFNRVKLEKPDPRLERYVRRVQVMDDDGHFVFSRVPAGSYYVSTHLRWDYPSTYTDNDGTIWNTTVDVDQWIYSKVAVRSGETVQVENWDQGK